MRLREYLQSDLVLPGLRAKSSGEALRTLARAVAEKGVVSDADALGDRLEAREAAHTTCLGNGVAVPHTTVDEMNRSLVVVALAPEGVPFGTPPEPVRVLFLLLSPPDRSSQHIKILARLARLVRHPGFVDRLVRADTPEAVLAEVERVDAEHV